jgi:hypothetical protein
MATLRLAEVIFDSLLRLTNDAGVGGPLKLASLQSVDGQTLRLHLSLGGVGSTFASSALMSLAHTR